MSGAEVVSASGGAAEDAGFLVSTSSTTVIGFSLTGSVVSAGEGILTVLEVIGSDPCMVDLVISGSGGIPLDAAVQMNLRETTTRVLGELTPREERVLRMRFGIGMNTDHTLEEVGQQFSVTRERIRQIEAKALRKLKHPSRSRKLKSFLDNN